MFNRNERDGVLAQAKGRVKKAVGDLTASDKLKAEGTVDEAVGKTKTAIGRAQKDVGATMKSLGKAVKR